MNSILEQFKHRGFESGGEVYLRPTDAQEFVRIACAAEFAIVGIEAVCVENRNILPLVDQIADFSSLSSQDWRQRVEASGRAAVAFLEQLPSDPRVMVTFTVVSSSAQPT